MMFSFNKADFLSMECKADYNWLWTYLCLLAWTSAKRSCFHVCLRTKSSEQALVGLSVFTAK